MNAVCPICSELLMSEDIVSTSCGHTFHHSCLKNWLVSSRTCPTCRSPCTASSLIKLYFEIDDNKGTLNIDEILKENEELNQQYNAEIEKNKKLGDEVVRLTNETMSLKRQRQLDEMAIAGFKNIKDESASQIVKLNEALGNLKLDLLAEKQLRRIHQQSLHNFDPQNENYDTANVKLDESRLLSNVFQSSTEASPKSLPRSIVPFWKLNCEAKPVLVNPKKTIQPSYIIPNKIQKGDQKNDKLQSRQNQRSLWSKGGKKPAGFPFMSPEAPASPPIASAAPSTSSFRTPTPKRLFGENFTFDPRVSIHTSSVPRFNFSLSPASQMRAGLDSDESPPPRPFPRNTDTPSPRSTDTPFPEWLLNYQSPSDAPPVRRFGEGSKESGDGPKSSER